MVKIEVRSKDERGHRRCAHFFGITPEVVECNDEDAAVLEACTALITRRMPAAEAATPLRPEAAPAASPVPATTPTGAPPAGGTGLGAKGGTTPDGDTKVDPNKKPHDDKR